MHPILASFGPLHLYSYGLFVGIGILAAIQLLRILAKTANLNPDTIVDLALVTIASGFSGARIFYVIQFWDHFRMSPLGILKIWEGGLVLYGGLAGGLLGFSIFVRVRKLPFPACLDLFVIAAALAQGFGRIGCFLNGCCFGRETKLPFGVSFPFLDHRVHPAQIYESLFCFGLAGLLLWMRRRKLVIAQPHRHCEPRASGAWQSLVLRSPRRPAFGGAPRDDGAPERLRKFQGGIVSAAYFLIYALGRFSIEFFRGDNVKLALNLTLAQWISLALTASALAFLFLIYGKQANYRPF